MQLGSLRAKGSDLQVAIEMDDTNGTVSRRHTTQQWEGDGMIAAKGDDSR